MRWDTSGCGDSAANKPDFQDRRIGLRAQFNHRALHAPKHPIEGKMAHRVLETGVIEIPQRAQPFRGQALRPNHIGFLALAGADQTIEKRPQLVRTWRGR